MSTEETHFDRTSLNTVNRFALPDAATANQLIPFNPSADTSIGRPMTARQSSPSPELLPFYM